jgi:hypothetical protein
MSNLISINYSMTESVLDNGQYLEIFQGVSHIDRYIHIYHRIILRKIEHPILDGSLKNMNIYLLKAILHKVKKSVSGLNPYNNSRDNRLTRRNERVSTICCSRLAARCLRSDYHCVSFLLIIGLLCSTTVKIFIKYHVKL